MSRVQVVEHHDDDTVTVWSPRDGALRWDDDRGELVVTGTGWERRTEPEPTYELTADQWADVRAVMDGWPRHQAEIERLRAAGDELAAAVTEWISPAAEVTDVERVANARLEREIARHA